MPLSFTKWTLSRFQQRYPPLLATSDQYHHPACHRRRDWQKLNHKLMETICSDSDWVVRLVDRVVRTVAYHQGTPDSIPTYHRDFRKARRVRRGASAQALLRAKEHLAMLGEVTGRKIVKLTSQDGDESHPTDVSDNYKQHKLTG